MNENRSGTLFLMLLGICVGLYAVFSVLLTEGNAVSELCRLLMGAGFVFCLISPRAGLLLWLASCGYIDLIKRLMVLSGRISHNDLYYVLGIHPLMMAGICLSIVAGAFMGRYRITGWHTMRLLFACGVLAVSAAAAAAQKGFSPMAVLPEVANSGIYAVLLFVVPIVLPTLEDMLRTLRMLVIVFVPVAAYGVVQQVVGFQDFELEYLMTGLSIEIKQLYADEIRAFSTLNSPTALAFVSAALFVCSLLIGWHKPTKETPFHFPRLPALILAAVYLAGLASSTARSAYVVIPVGLLAGSFFQSAGRTRLFYAVLVSSFVALVASSKWLLAALPAAMSTMYQLSGGNVFAAQILRVGTYSERLTGFANVLANPDAYSLFGFGKDRGQLAGDEFLNHDPLSGILISYGSLVLGLAIVAVAVLLIQVHRSVLHLEPGPKRAAAAVLLSIPLSYLVASMLQGNVFSTFPINGFTWLFLGMIQSLGQPARTAASVQAAPIPASRLEQRSAFTGPLGHRSQSR